MSSVKNGQFIINNDNKIKSTISCIYCDKSYKTRGNLDKHLVLCETIHKSIRNRQNPLNEDDDMELPTQKQMYKIILDLAAKYNKLEEKMEQMTKWVDKKKKKINVLEWLQVNMKPEIAFSDLIDQIIITDTDIETVLAGNFIEMLNEILTHELFEKSFSNDACPIFCFLQKANSIYIYDYDKSSEDTEPVWKEIARDKIVYLINKIHIKITRKLTEWRRQLESENKYSNAQTELYNKTVMKLMSIDSKQDTTINKIKGLLYGRMKIDMKTLIEYEFEF